MTLVQEMMLMEKRQ